MLQFRIGFLFKITLTKNLNKIIQKNAQSNKQKRTKWKQNEFEAQLVANTLHKGFINQY